MPTVELIDPASIPPAVRDLCSEDQRRAVGHLREAYQARRALLLRLAESERADRLRNCYQRAAKRLKIQVRISGAEPRPYQKTTNQEGKEASVLYVRIVAGPAATQAVATAAPFSSASVNAPRTADHAVARGPLDGIRPPLEERKKRGPKPKPKFTIPTPGAQYQDLGRGIEADR